MCWMDALFDKSLGTKYTKPTIIERYPQKWRIPDTHVCIFIGLYEYSHVLVFMHFIGTQTFLNAWIALPLHDPCCQMQKVHVIPIMFRRDISRSKRYPARAVESPEASGKASTQFKHWTGGRSVLFSKKRRDSNWPFWCTRWSSGHLVLFFPILLVNGSLLRFICVLASRNLCHRDSLAYAQPS